MQILWTKSANRNLEQAAIDIVLKIIETVEILIEHPAMGRPGRVVGTRELVIANTPYIVPYRVKGNRIEILRVLHGTMQWPEAF